MTKIAFIESLRRRVSELRAANGANVTITFALAVIPIVGFVGAAIDYSHGNAIKASMQAAADSTSLMLSKVANGLNDSQIQTKANDYFKALFVKPEANNLTIKATYTTTNGNQILVHASSDVPTHFMTLLGQSFSSMKIGVDSQVKWGNTRLRVALVLDNTGSMADDNKMTALISATNSLLTQLKSAVTTNGDVYVSIVPFVKDVNVGSGNYQATWIDWTEWNKANGDCNRNKYDDSYDDCISHGKVWTPDNHNTWNGCVVDRGTASAPASGNYDTNVTAPNVNTTATLYAAEQYSSCPNAAVKALSYDWSGMTTLVNSMTPNGNTNQAIGLQLGWMSLVGGGPFPAPPAMDPNYTYQQIIILLTDGLNTQDRWYTSQTSIDNRQKMTCDNVNTAKITLYTVQVNTGGDPTSTLLKNCAGSPGKYPDNDKFFLVTSSGQIATTFQQIGTNLSNLRISQ